MKSLHLALSLTAFVLAACGSSGNGSFTSSKLLPNDYKPSVNSTAAPSNNANSNSTAAPSNNANSSGTAAPSNNANSNNTAAPSNNANSNNTAANGSSSHTGLEPLGNHVIAVEHIPYESVKNKGYTPMPLSEQRVPKIISINGVKIDLEASEFANNLVDPNDFTNKKKTFGKILKYDNVKAVWIQGHPDLSGKIGYGWVQGEESKRIPPHGKYYYFGFAHVHRGLEPVDLIDQNNISSMSQLSNIHFNVDFAAKKMDGYIDVDRANTRYKLAADIQGTRFAGVKDGTTLQGAFYGQDGAEMAGSLINTNDKNNPMYGVFVGSKGTKIAD